MFPKKETSEAASPAVAMNLETATSAKVPISGAAPSAKTTRSETDDYNPGYTDTKTPTSEMASVADSATTTVEATNVSFSVNAATKQKGDV